MEKLKKRIEFRVTLIDGKLIKTKAKEAGFSISEYCRKAVLRQKLNNKLTSDEVEIYLLLQQYRNNFNSISNYFKNKNPQLSDMCIDTAIEIKKHLQKLKK